MVECNHITLLHLYINYIINAEPLVTMLLYYYASIVYLESQFYLGDAKAWTGVPNYVKY